MDLNPPREVGRQALRISGDRRRSQKRSVRLEIGRASCRERVCLYV